MTAEGNYNSPGTARSQYYHLLFVLNQRHASMAELFYLCMCAYSVEQYNSINFNFNYGYVF